MNKENSLRVRIGKQLREFREEKNISIRELSEQIGINHSNICAIENGKYNARLDTLEKLEVFFGKNLMFVNDGK